MAFQQRTQDESWGSLKQRILTRWPGLSAEEVERTNGDRDTLVGLLQAQLGYAEPNARRDLDEVMRGHAITPRDVADEDSHTGSSGPVPNTQVPSSVTSFPDRAGEARAAGGSPSASGSMTSMAGRTGMTESGSPSSQPAPEQVSDRAALTEQPGAEAPQPGRSGPPRSNFGNPDRMAQEHGLGEAERNERWSGDQQSSQVRGSQSGPQQGQYHGPATMQQEQGGSAMRAIATAGVVAAVALVAMGGVMLMRRRSRRRRIAILGASTAAASALPKLLRRVQRSDEWSDLVDRAA